MSTDPTDRPAGEPERRRAPRRHVVRLPGRGWRAIDEFLVEVANVLELPPKDPAFHYPFLDPQSMAAAGTDEAPDGGRSSAPRTGFHRRVWLPLLAVLVLVYWGLSLLGWSVRRATVPVAFRGTWVSAHQDYEGRKLVITESTVHVIVSEDTSSHPAVVRSAIVHSTPIGPELRMVCATADGADTIHVTLLTPGKLVLRRPSDVIWERRVDQRTAPPDAAAPPETERRPSPKAAPEPAPRGARH